MKKLVMSAAVAAMLASAAFAQSFSHGTGTGNMLPFRYAPTTHQSTPTTDRRNGEQGFASVLHERSDLKPDSPTNTGGGSTGYNWNLRHNY